MANSTKNRRKPPNLVKICVSNNDVGTSSILFKVRMANTFFTARVPKLNMNSVNISQIMNNSNWKF